MKKKIREILSKYRGNQGYTMEHAESELLNLFSVVKQGEQLIAFAEWKEYNGKWQTHEEQVKNFLKEYKSN